MSVSNSEYLVTARKWRPLKFSDIVGQKHITTTLKNAIKSEKIHHAYLFSGPRGVGKTTAARIYARAINCEKPKNNEPCNECPSCQAILEGRSLDVIEIDGASNNSVEDIRKLRENAKYPPVSGNYKMYIIDEVHMLSTSAFNALLKTLEEPPPHLLFVFATTESQKVLPTILSRCQRFDFRRMEIASIVKQLKLIAANEDIKIDDESLNAVAQKADGSMRDSQSIFDQVVAFCGNNISYNDLADALHLIDKEFFFKLSEYIRTKNLNAIFEAVQEIISRGYDLTECITGLLEHYRNILSVNVTKKTSLIEDSKDIKKRYVQEAQEYNQKDLLRILHTLVKTEQGLRFAPQPRVHFELALVQLASMDSVLEISELLGELKKMSKEGFSNQSTLFGGLADDSAKKKAVTETKEESKPVTETKSSQYKKTIEKLNKPISVEENQVEYTKSSIDAAEIESKWFKFLEEKANGDSGLFSLKQKDVCQVNFLNGEVVIKCNNGFISDTLEEKKHVIQEKLREYYNSSISVKVIYTDFTDKNSNEENPAPVTNKENEDTSSKAKSEEEISPIEEALVSMFNAKQIKIN